MYSSSIKTVERSELPDGRRLFFVDWNLGNKCHYACSYCPSYLHDGSSKLQSLSSCSSFVDWIFQGVNQADVQPHFHFAGGEPTIYEHFDWLIKKIKQESTGIISLVSNGARPPSWWRKMASQFDHITLSLHHEYANYERFSKVVEACVIDSFVHINVPASPDDFDNCVQMFRKLGERFPSITLTLKPILKGFRDTLVDYSDFQLELLRTIRPHSSRAISNTSPIPPLVVIDVEGKKHTASASKLLANELNRFEGWQCWAGIESLAVTTDGSIYRAVCKEGGRLGSIHESLPEFPMSTIQCRKARCKCLSDIQIRKTRLI